VHFRVVGTVTLVKIVIVIIIIIIIIIINNAYVCGRSIAGIAGSNPTEDLDVLLFCLLCVV
jgi:hypothetical protein